MQKTTSQDAIGFKPLDVPELVPFQQQQERHKLLKVQKLC